MKLFGPSRNEIWRKLSESLHGRFIDGGFMGTDRVEVTHNEWVLTLDSFVANKTPHTRMRAPFVNPGGFRFRVYRKSIFSGAGKLFGMQDIEIGDPDFDEAFIIQATDEGTIRWLLNARLRELISQQKEISLSVKDDEGFFVTHFPDGVDELYFAVPGMIKDVDRLKSLFDLFAETLDELCRIGAAEKGPANVDVS